MPIKYKILLDRRLVFAVGIGEVTYEDLAAHIDDLVADPDYVSPMKKLIDYRKSTLARLTTEQTIQISAKKTHHIERFEKERCAFVTPKDLDFGMARFHEAHIDGAGIEICVFRELDEALSWLDTTIEAAEMDLS